MYPSPSHPRYLTAPRWSDQRGAQALEFSLVMPCVLLLVLLVFAAGQVVLGATATHQLAAIAARTAAVSHDDRVHAVLAPTDVTDVNITPASGSRQPGDPVTVTLTRPVAVLALGHAVEVTARATYRTEDVP